MNVILAFLILMAFLIAGILLLSIKIVPYMEAWVIERLGKYSRTLYSGVRFVLPVIERVANRVSLKERFLDVEKQDVITKDNVRVEIDAICYYQIFDPYKATYNIENLEYAIEQTIQTLLRDIIGGMSLDEILSSREVINNKIKEDLSQIIKDWGVNVKRIEVKEINPPEDVIKAMTKIIEADRTKKAMITEAEGKKQAQILEAEGLKMAKFLEAEALERLGEAQTHVILKLAEEIGDPKLASLVFIGNEYVEALKDMAREKNSKLIILPPNTNSILDLVSSLQAQKKG